MSSACSVGVDTFLIPGTNQKTSQRALEIAEINKRMYAAVGVHPHHVFDIYRKIQTNSLTQNNQSISGEISEISQELINQEIDFLKKYLEKTLVVAVGEIGLDRHMYEKTVYKDYIIDETFLDLQKIILKKQIFLAIKYSKSVIFHNRETRKELLETIEELWDESLRGRCVFHCCESHKDILSYAKKKKIYIGVDGDITYDRKKQQFIAEVPIEMLVIETDSPFILPEPYRARKEFPNEPKHLYAIAKWVAKIKGIPVNEVAQITSENGFRLFQL